MHDDSTGRCVENPGAVLEVADMAFVPDNRLSLEYLNITGINQIKTV